MRGVPSVFVVGAFQASVADPAVTVSVVDPDMLPNTAVTVVEPAATVEARPEELIVATPVLDELQVALLFVRSCVVLSENVPVATNCRAVPAGMLGLVGLTAIDTSVALVTEIVVEPEVLPDVAVTVVEPAFFPYAYAFPLVVVFGAVWLSMAISVEAVATSVDAMLVSNELQVTDAVMSLVVPSEYTPVAVNGWLVFIAMLALAGSIEMERSRGSVLPDPLV